MQSATRILSVIATALIGVALLGAGLIVGVAVIGVLAVAYLVHRLTGKNVLRVKKFRVASCPECGRLTDQKTCSCGGRISWL